MTGTESAHPASHGLGEMTPAQVIALMAAEEPRVLAAVEAVGQRLAALADDIARCTMAGRRTVMLGAGTSGRLALQEVAELPPTFGVPAEQFCALIASKVPLGPTVVAPTEDDTESVVGALRELEVSAGDVVIGVAASGRTPFVLAGLRAATSAGARTWGIANNPDTPLLTVADHGIFLDTGPELLTGSTRLKAGTAQKIALNRATTAAMVAAGRVVGNHMRELTGTNDKLRARAVNIVMEISGVSMGEAIRLLLDSGWHVSAALEKATSGPVRAEP